MDFERINRERFCRLFPSVSCRVGDEEELDQKMQEYIQNGMFLGIESLAVQREESLDMQGSDIRS